MATGKRKQSAAQRRVLELGRQIGAAEALGDHDKADELREELRGGSGESSGSRRGRSGERTRTRDDSGSGAAPRSRHGSGRGSPRVVEGGYGSSRRSGRGDERRDDDTNDDDLEDGSNGQETETAGRGRWWHRFYGW